MSYFEERRRGFFRGDLMVDGKLTVAGGIAGALTNGDTWFVDGTNGSATGDGRSWSTALSTIQAAVTAATEGDVIYIAPKSIAAGETDPSSYAETVIIPAGKANLSLIGLNRGRTQGGLPQIKKGSGTTALLTVRSPGCLIANIGFNGIWTADSTQSLVGILLDDDSLTKSAFGTTIVGCHFKNCAGSTGSTNAATGGAITWSTLGNAWQVLIQGCRFYKNVGDIVLIGTSGSVPQDVIIEDNVFSGPAANVDCNLYLAGGSGMNGVIVRNNTFGQLPAIGSGTNARYIKATGCVGMLVGNTFGCQTASTGGTRITFKADGTGAFIPTTMHVAGNYGQSITASETGEISIA
jgi:hypothetical protein